MVRIHHCEQPPDLPMRAWCGLCRAGHTDAGREAKGGLPKSPLTSPSVCWEPQPASGLQSLSDVVLLISMLCACPVQGHSAMPAGPLTQPTEIWSLPCSKDPLCQSCPEDASKCESCKTDVTVPTPGGNSYRALYLDAKEKCQLCPEDCFFCDQTTACDSCLPGYTQVGKKCVR